MSMKKKSEPEVTWSDYRRLSETIKMLHFKIRLLVRIMVDKKQIEPELAKSFEETMFSMVMYEGFNFTEAKLTYARREKLPSGAFCGPNRTYPAHDVAHVRNALTRLSQFGKRLKPAVRARILACLKRRAKRYKIEVGETVAGKLCLAKWDETLDEKTRKKMLIEIEETVSWWRKKQK